MAYLNQVFVPIEIMEIIFEQLALDRATYALNECSRTCSTFYVLCMKHLFATIELDAMHGSEKPTVRSFKRLLDRNPKIANCVQTLEYVNNFEVKEGPRLLRRLHNVRKFTFGFNDHDMFGSYQQDWRTIPSTLKSSLRSFLRSNLICDLSLINLMNFPIYIFTQLPHLVTLHIGNLTVVDSPMSSTVGITKIPQLQNLLIQDCAESMRKLLSTKQDMSPILDFTRVEVLTMTVESLEGLAILERLLQLSVCLKALDLLGNPDHPPYQNFHGSVARCLTPQSSQTLETVALCLMINKSRYDPYMDFVLELEQMEGGNVLRNIDIDIGVDTDCRCSTNPSAWRKLDEVLSRPGFSHLRHVSLAITMYHLNPPRDDLKIELEMIGAKQFPWLSSANSVKFKFAFSVEAI
ncbi:hypothetical protein B0H34DRAFT_686450 [Crassisporium funariophilum]|nr:hypothetical protein B0H34DRAFT_686450 [Crassisporium funariophilum]